MLDQEKPLADIARLTEENDRLRKQAREHWHLAVTVGNDMERMRELLRDVVVAAGRMRDHWAEADDAVKRQLWSALHTAADAAEDDVYPLAAEVELTPQQRERFEAAAERGLAKRRAGQSDGVGGGE